MALKLEARVTTEIIPAVASGGRSLIILLIV